jgi:hypothetical protein
VLVIPLQRIWPNLPSFLISSAASPFSPRGWLLRARSVGLTAFAEAKSFSPLPKLLKSSSAPASEMLPGLPTGKQRPKRFARMYKSKLENLRIKKLEVIRFIQEPFQLHANAA